MKAHRGQSILFIPRGALKVEGLPVMYSDVTLNSLFNVLFVAKLDTHII